MKAYNWFHSPLITIMQQQIIISTLHASCVPLRGQAKVNSQYKSPFLQMQVRYAYHFSIYHAK